ncbi:MAG TPA: DsbA family protein [Allosphingosinicella sp.]|nr:DsbA family protein [Allosphingosinicella sp.]
MTDAEASASRGRLLGGWKGALIAAILGALVGGALMALFSGQLVRRYLLANPEIIPEAMQRLEDRKTADTLAAHRAAIETPFASAWAGAKDGDVVLVEFFDYACSYCRKSIADVERLIGEDRKLKVVWRELPVLGPGSEDAAQVSLAAAKAGRFKPFYDRMFALGRPSAGTIAEASRAVGLTGAQAEEMSGSPAALAELRRNYELAQVLRSSGTPTFVVGDRVLNGAVGYDTLKEAIAEARTRDRG